MVVLGTELGVESGEDGEFRLAGLPLGRYGLSISMLGYAAYFEKNLNLEITGIHLDIGLLPSPLELPALIVSATKRPRSFVDASTSVAVLGGDEILEHNSVSLDESLDYVPGVHMVSGQVNIRGSSGFSRGIGSRVLMLLDGFPALSADNADVKWDAIPVDQIERVEIIKGAGSALYGTGALGGIVNVITRNPSARPETRFRILAGVYSDPVHPEWEWASGKRLFENLDVTHSSTSGKLGYILGLGQKWTNGFKENGWHRRYKGYGKFKYAFTPTSNLTATLNWARDDHGVFVQWKDRNEPLEVPLSSKGDKTVSGKLHLNLSYYLLASPVIGYRVRSFLYRTEFNNRVGGATSSAAYKFGQEFQTDLQKGEDLSLTAGLEWIADRVDSSPTLFGRHSGLNLAAYMQAELLATNKLGISAGWRFDRYRTDDRPAEIQFSPRLGLTYKMTPTNSLRTTLGWGFRGPSIAEIYTNATFSAVPIAPNTDLVAERSLSYEIGLNNRSLSWLRLDAAVFWSRYRDLVEARPDVTGVVSFRNVSKGRISGVEASLVASWRILDFDAGYTFMDAKENLPSGDQPLPYRHRHISSSGLKARLGAISSECRFTYKSKIEKASGLFPEGTRDLIPVYLIDLSFGYKIGHLDFTLKVHNLTEYNYARVERNLGTPRRFSIGISGTY